MTSCSGRKSALRLQELDGIVAKIVELANELFDFFISREFAFTGTEYAKIIQLTKPPTSHWLKQST